jgi:7,8-dihydro-6-hydroxymethylpterin-pyrophosphokinase
MHERAFVLKPLYEVAPHASIPGVGSVKDCLQKTQNQEAERIV